MRLLKSIFKFQLKKAIKKRNVLVYLLIAVILQVFLQVGKANHKDMLESNETFQSQQRQKASRYKHYGQYGSFGIWLKFIPNANSILFCDSIYNNLFCNANSTYVFNIYTPIKSRSVFANRSRFLTFSAMFLLFGVLGCLVYGMDFIVRKDYFKFISTLTERKKAFCFTVTARLIILFSAAIILYAISVLPLLVFDGINLFNTSFPVLLVIILSFLFFFSIGCLIGHKKSQFTRNLILGVAYFLAVILLPWLMGLYSEISAKDLPPIIEFDFRNFNVLMQEEDEWNKKHVLPKGNKAPSEEGIKDFKKGMIKMKKIFRKNEDKLKSQSSAKIKTQQTISSLFPTLFYFSTCESSSSTGVNSYMDFHSYCEVKKDGFSDFIRENSFKDKDEKVENFIKGDEDLFFAKPKLPYNFGLGAFLTPFYAILLLFFSFRAIKKRQKIPEPKKAYQLENEKNNPLFVLCENEEIKTDIFNYYQHQKASVCLEKINTGDFMFNGVKPHELFSHLCQVSGIDEKKAREHLAHMGIEDLSNFELDDETILKIYAAVITAADFESMFLNDFVKKESRDFEIDIFKLLSQLVKEGKKIIYLSCQMLYPTNSISIASNFKVDEFEPFPLDFDNNTVR